MTDLALVTASHSPTGPVGTVPAVGMAGELVGHVLAELPALAVLDGRDRLLAAAWLASLRSARTRRSYAGDLLGWQTWLAERGLELLAAGRVQADLWVRTQQHAGAGDASVQRRLSGIGSFYRYCLTHDLGTGPAQPPGLAGAHEQGLHHRQGDQLGVGDLRSDPLCKPPGALYVDSGESGSPSRRAHRSMGSTPGPADQLVRPPEARDGSSVK